MATRTARGRIAAACVTLALLLLNSRGHSAPQAAAHPLGAQELQRALSMPLVFRGEEIELRPALRQIMESRRIGWLLDRRVDPNRPLSWEIDSEPLFTALERTLLPQGSRPLVIGATVCVAPEVPAAPLRTLIALRRDEFRLLSGWPAARRSPVLERLTLTWSAPSDPRELFRTAGKRWGLVIDGLEELPDDLWAEGTLASVDGIEALTLLLNQFERTFAWGPQPSHVRLVAIPQQVSLKRVYPLPERGRDELLEAVASLDPVPQAAVHGAQLTVVGTVEQQEAVSGLLHPQADVPRGEVPQSPLNQRHFTLTIRQVRCRDALDALIKQGIDVQYDAQVLEAAGIDLDQRLDLTLQHASIEQLLDGICKPAGLDYTVSSEQVTIRPATGQ